MNVFLQDPAAKFHETATRLYMKIGYEAHDFLAADTIITAILNLH